MRIQYSSLTSDRPAFSRMRKLIHFVYVTFLALLLFSCADHSNVVDPSTDSTIEDWFNVAVPSSVSISSSSTATVTSSDAASSSTTPSVSSSDAVAVSSSTTPNVSSSVTIAIFSSTIPIVSSSVVVAISSSIKPSSSSIAVSSSKTPSSSSVPVSSSAPPSSSSVLVISPNPQTCPYYASGNTGTLECEEKIYATIVIGTQTWMAENLNYSPINGTSLCYNNVPANCITYGRLYNWATAKVACPIGWHLPTDAEWKTLEANQGMTQAAADSIYQRGTIGDILKDSSSLWTTNTGTNSSGFSALPGGNYSYPNSFTDLGLYTEFWAAPNDGSNTPWYRGLAHNTVKVYRGTSSILLGKSLRCLKD